MLCTADSLTLLLLLRRRSAGVQAQHGLQCYPRWLSGGRYSRRVLPQTIHRDRRPARCLERSTRRETQSAKSEHIAQKPNHYDVMSGRHGHNSPLAASGVIQAPNERREVLEDVRQVERFQGVSVPLVHGLQSSELRSWCALGVLQSSLVRPTGLCIHSLRAEVPESRHAAPRSKLTQYHDGIQRAVTYTVPQRAEGWWGLQVSTIMH